MRILVLCDTTFGGSAIARCLSQDILAVVTAGPTHLCAQAEEGIFTFQYEEPEELVNIGIIGDIDVIIPTSMSQMFHLLEVVEDLPLVMTGLPNRDPFSRDTLWDAVKACGYKPVGRATEAPAVYMSSPTASNLIIAAKTDVGYKALSALPGDMIDTCTGMLECKIDFIAEHGNLLAAACRDCLVAKNDMVRVAEVHELSEEMLVEVSAILSKMEYHGPGTLTGFLVNNEMYWVDLNICLNEGMEMAAAAGLNIPLMSLRDTGGVDYVPRGLETTLIYRELMTYGLQAVNTTKQEEE